jgi:hypothetical protein
MASVPIPNDAAGYAALAICESLLVALTDLRIMAEKDSRDLLTDAASAHREAGTNSNSPELHDAVTAIIERILAGKNSLPH